MGCFYIISVILTVCLGDGHSWAKPLVLLWRRSLPPFGWGTVPVGSSLWFLPNFTLWCSDLELLPPLASELFAWFPLCLPNLLCPAWFKEPNVEAAQVSIDRWMDTQIVVHPHSGILFSPKDEGDSDTCYTLDEPRGHKAPWQKPTQKDKCCLIPPIGGLSTLRFHCSNHRGCWSIISWSCTKPRFHHQDKTEEECERSN